MLPVDAGAGAGAAPKIKGLVSPPVVAGGALAPNIKGLVSPPVVVGVALAPPNMKGLGSLDPEAGATAGVTVDDDDAAVLAALKELPVVDAGGAAEPNVNGFTSSTLDVPLLLPNDPNEGAAALSVLTGPVAAVAMAGGFDTLLLSRFTPAGIAGNAPKERAPLLVLADLDEEVADPIPNPPVPAVLVVVRAGEPKLGVLLAPNETDGSAAVLFFEDCCSSDSSLSEASKPADRLALAEESPLVFDALKEKLGSVGRAETEPAAEAVGVALVESTEAESGAGAKKNPAKGAGAAAAGAFSAAGVLLVAAGANVNPTEGAFNGRGDAPKVVVVLSVAFLLLVVEVPKVKSPLLVVLLLLPVEGVVAAAAAAPKINPPLPIAPGATLEAEAEADAPNPSKAGEAVEFDVAAEAAVGADPPPRGASQETHLVAPFLLLTIHESHFTPLLILAAAQMPVPILVTGVLVAAVAAAAPAGAVPKLELEAGAAVEGLLAPFALIGDSHAAHFVAPFSFLDIQTGHFTPLLMLEAAQIFTVGVEEASLLAPAPAPDSPAGFELVDANPVAWEAD